MSRRQKFLALSAALGIATVLGGCLALSPHPMDNTQIDAYSELAQKPGPAPPARHAGGVERWQQLLSDFSAENLRGQVASVYAQETFFNDTLKTLRDPQAIEEYLLETSEMLHYGRVEYEDVAVSGDDVYVRWRMVYRSKKLSKDQDIVTIGMSHLRFDDEGKVILHQDFWDSTRGIFEHVPLIGSGIRAVKKRL